MSRYLVSLGYREYRKLWLATLCSQSASWALIVARAALVLQMTGSATWTGAVTFAAMIPSVFVSPLAGYLADRFDRRTVLAYAYAVNVTDNLVLAFLVVTGLVEPWHVLILSAITGSARSTQIPAGQALMANMVPRERLLNAVSLYQATFHGSRFVGPFLILVVLWATGRQDWVFFLCAGLYILGFTIVLTVKTASRGAIQAGKFREMFLGNLVAGLTYMYRHPLVLSLVLLVVAHCGMTMSFESLLPVFAQDKLDMEGSAAVLNGFSYLMVAFGIAALAAALMLAGVRTEAARGKWLLWLGAASGASAVGLAMSPNLEMALLSASMMGFAQGGFMTLSHAMLQTIAPDEIRGRMLGVYSWHTNGTMAGFNMVNGALAGLAGLSAPLILGAGGVGFLLVMTMSFGRIPLRQLYSRGVPAT
jgi:MFS family permease